MSAHDDATIAVVTATSPDVLVLSSSDEQQIMDLSLAVRAVEASLRMVVLTDELLARQLTEDDRLQGDSVLVRGDDHLEDIGAVLRIAHRGGRVTSCPRPQGYGAPARPSVDAHLASRLDLLSTREKIVLHELAKGRTNAQIAQPLHVSVATIKADLAHIMAVLQASSRVDLAVQAVLCGLVNSDVALLPGDHSTRNGGGRRLGADRRRSAATPTPE